MIRAFVRSEPLFSFLAVAVTVSGLWLVLGAGDLDLILLFPAWLFAWLGLVIAAVAVVLRAHRRRS